MAESTSVRVPALRARLVTVPFGDVVHIFAGRKRLSNLPATSYIRTIQLNMQTASVELMVIDPSFEPLDNLGDMKTVPAEIVPADAPAPGMKRYTNTQYPAKKGKR